MQHRIVSMVCVPLTIKHETIGVMQILNKRSGNDTARDRMLLEQFANQGGCG
jgi:GAF domain-containing protein